MSIEKNIQSVKDFFAAAFGGDSATMLALAAEDIEWIVPGEDWPLAGTHRGHAGLTELLKTESETMELSLSEPREYIALGDRVLVVGYAEGKVKATNKPFTDDWIFAITVRDGKLTNIREYVDTQALARAAAVSDPENAADVPGDGSDLRAS
ncbi:nuclear transport factor 2 family protein [Sphingomonas crusticola]|uniref:nuclear transport factor 2 family protein n=1 Tax=Sphingomonas crusticola TaxID=1697973 RepID=UPI000E24B151|nr:nuclear transport factor 2 family protein [Sphingomonas crusticola]